MIREFHETIAGRKILVVDDEPSVAGLIRDILDEDGAAVTVVHDGSDAMETIAVETYDLVLLDMSMPGVDGRAVLEDIFQNYPRLVERTILLTGHRYDVELVRQMHQLQLPALYKPFDVADMRAAVCATLSIAELIQARQTAA
jgi:DNA-binding response OmpR family regulator